MISQNPLSFFSKNPHGLVAASYESVWLAMLTKFRLYRTIIIGMAKWTLPHRLLLPTSLLPRETRQEIILVGNQHTPRETGQQGGSWEAVDVCSSHAPFCLCEIDGRQAAPSAGGFLHPKPPPQNHRIIDC